MPPICPTCGHSQLQWAGSLGYICPRGCRQADETPKPEPGVLPIIVFAVNDFYPLGGWKDMYGLYPSVEAAIEATTGTKADHLQFVDTVTWRCFGVWYRGQGWSWRDRENGDALAGSET